MIIIYEKLVKSEKIREALDRDTQLQTAKPRFYVAGIKSLVNRGEHTRRRHRRRKEVNDASTYGRYTYNDRLTVVGILTD